MEEIFIVDDLASGTIKVARSLKEVPKGSGIITHRIKGNNLEIEHWEVSKW